MTLAANIATGAAMLALAAFAILAVVLTAAPQAEAKKTSPLPGFPLPGFETPKLLSNDADYAVVAIETASDGRFVVAATEFVHGRPYLSRVIRLRADGSIDSTFTPYIPGGSVNDIVVLPDGRMVVAGTFGYQGTSGRAYLHQLNADGSRNHAFAEGTVPFDGPVVDLLLRPDGSLLVAGGNDYCPITTVCTHGDNGWVKAVTVDGQPLDAEVFDAPAFDGGVGAVAPAPDGSLYVSGNFSHVGDTPVDPPIIRLNADGSHDPTFEADVGAPSEGSPKPGDRVFAPAMKVQADGRLLAGVARQALWPHKGDSWGLADLVRLLPDGSRDQSFKQEGYTGKSRLIRVDSIETLPGGKLVVAGRHQHHDGRFLLERLKPNGKPDARWANSATRKRLVSWGNGHIHATRLLPGNKMLVGGAFTKFGGQPAMRVAKVSLRNLERFRVKYFRKPKVGSVITGWTLRGLKFEAGVKSVGESLEGDVSICVKPIGAARKAFKTVVEPRNKPSKRLGGRDCQQSMYGHRGNFFHQVFVKADESKVVHGKLYRFRVRLLSRDLNTGVRRKPVVRTLSVRLAPRPVGCGRVDCW